MPRSGSKTKTKWIDLVLAEPNVDSPQSVVWIELKDIGRSEPRVLDNAKGLGHDLAALWTINPMLTQELWINPLPHSIDQGRLGEWNRYGPNIACDNQLISQIVLCFKGLCSDIPLEKIKEQWLNTFLSRCDSSTLDVPSFQISHAETDAFIVFGLVEKPRHNLTI